jgi:hypothetical protein
MVAAVLYKAGVPASFKAGFVADSLAWGSLTHFYLGMDLSAQADPAAAWHEEVSRQYDRAAYNLRHHAALASRAGL